MKHKHGNLITLAKAGEFDVIIHGANCQSTMRSGVAGQLVREYPEIAETDANYHYKGRHRLGRFSECQPSGATFKVLNAYTQQYYGYDSKRYVSYDAVDSAFRLIAQEFPDSRIGLPMIGAGLANGNWNILNAIIGEALYGMDWTLVSWDGS